MRHLTLLILVASAAPAAPVPVPVADQSLPTPPQQRKPWTPPQSEVPEAFVTAAAKLFELGLADPRGCEYRAVTLTIIRQYTTEAEPVKTHAWVLPATPAMWRYAICWDGIVYPVQELGPAADLANDVRQRGTPVRRISAGADARPGQGQRPPEPFQFWNRLPDATGVLLLLRLGEGELAAQARAAVQLSDPYVDVAKRWATDVLAVGIDAHARRDDRLALGYLSLLDTAAPALEAEARQRGWKPLGLEKRLFDQGGQLPLLFADQRRRKSQPRRPPLVCFGPGRHPDPQVRIAGMIDRLDEFENPSGLPWARGPGHLTASQALFDEGEAAVEPLLKCLESDERLTRAVAGRDTFRRGGGTVASVAEAAKQVLARHLTGLDVRLPTGDVLVTLDAAARKELAARVRERLRQPDARVPVFERYFRKLADDAAKPQEWLTAASYLTNNVVPNSYASPPAAAPPADGPPAPSRPQLVGEPLRSRTNPSLTDLLNKRARQTQAGWIASALALAQVKWDPRAADRAVLAEVMRRCAKQHDFSNYTRLLAARLDLNDLTALSDYATWVRALTPDSYGTPVGADPFRLMWEHPDDPSVLMAADHIFADPASPWVPIQRPRANALNAGRALDLVRSPLIRLPSFRAAVLAMLADKSAVGTVRANARGAPAIQYDGVSQRFYFGSPPADTPAGYVGPFRACDYAAFTIGHLNTSAAPLCQLYWPEAKRDAAVAACVEFVERYGPRLDANGQATFPLRTRPATAEEVRRGGAIFSLDGVGQARVVPLPDLPRAARWTTLKEVATVSRQRDATGKSLPVSGYHQDGKVWQAEEVLQDGKWRRYYGFAGGHRVARVPAEEIEFPGYSFDIGGEFGLRTRRTLDVKEPVVGRPVPVSLFLRNRSGLPAAAPDLGSNAVRLWYAPAVASPQGSLVPSGGKGQDWEELKPRPATDPAGPGRQSLEAGEEVRVEIDLARRFDLNRPGFYRVRLAADKTPPTHNVGDGIGFYLAPPAAP